jgi:catechol 2,3-dioxygenase-like lactoylglutathione lyase family enzyme
MLAQNRMVAFLSTTDAGRARVFYESVLGLTFTGDHGPVVTFEGSAARLMLQKTDTVTPPHGTALGWIVGDIRAAIQALSARGVVFERFSEMDQDDLGVWSPAPGAGVAWFKDPDGNLLSLSQSDES